MMPMMTALFREHDLDRLGDDAELHQGDVEEALAAEQRHPAGGAHGVADEQRQHHQHDEHVLEARLRAREHVGEREGQHQADHRAEQRHPQRGEEDVGVERVGEELDVVLERERLDHHHARLELVEAVAEQDQDRQQQAEHHDDGRRPDQHAGGRGESRRAPPRSDLSVLRWSAPCHAAERRAYSRRCRFVIPGERRMRRSAFALKRQSRGPGGHDEASRHARR